MHKKRDLESIIELCRLHALYENSDFNDANKKEKLSEQLFKPDPNLKCLIVENDREVVGYATFFMQYSTWNADYYLYLDCLFLKEHIRGNGIGSELMKSVKEYAKTKNYSIIQWQTPTFNSNAIRFYENLGAERKSKERFFWYV